MDHFVCSECRLLPAGEWVCEHDRTAASAKAPDAVRSKPGLLRRLFRIFRWLSLGWSLVTFSLILTPALPPAIATSPDAAQSVDVKVLEFERALLEGRARPLEISEAELNGWITSKLSLQHTDTDLGKVSPEAVLKDPRSSKRSLAAAGGADRKITEIQSPLRDVRIELLKDSFLAYVAFNRFGKALSLQIEGRINAKDGYFSVQPTAGKFGSLPILHGALETFAHWFFDSPQNRQNFRLPSKIHDIRVESGNLVIVAY